MRRWCSGRLVLALATPSATAALEQACYALTWAAAAAVRGLPRPLDRPCPAHDASQEALSAHRAGAGAPPEATWEASLPPVRHQAKQQRPQAPPSHAEAPRALRAGGDDRRRAADQLLGGEGGGPGLLGPGGLRLPGGSAAAEGRPWVREVGPASAGQPQGLDPADEPEGPHLAHASARTRDLLRRSKGLPKEELLDLAEDARLRGNEAFKCATAACGRWGAEGGHAAWHAWLHGGPCHVSVRGRVSMRCHVNMRGAAGGALHAGGSCLRIGACGARRRGACGACGGVPRHA
jgi:hypothetical protein